MFSFKLQAGDSPLHWAVMLGNIKSVQFLISKGAYIEEQNYNKNTPLMIAATGVNLPIMEVLLRQGRAEVNRENSAQLTPLHAACLGGSTKAVGMLLDAEADFMKKDKVTYPH